LNREAWSFNSGQGATDLLTIVPEKNDVVLSESIALPEPVKTA
jgi:hypothetical protein